MRRLVNYLINIREHLMLYLF
ncbi:DUF2770 family protein, partial [Escherichia coli]